MNEKLRQLIAQAEARNNEAKALYEQGKHEEAVKALEDVKALRAQIDTEKRTADVAEALKANAAWFADPVNAIPVAGDASTEDATKGGGRPDNGTQPRGPIVGWQKAGTSLVYNRAVMDEEGFGNVSAKQWTAITSDAYTKAFLAYVRKSGRVTADEAKVLQEGIDDQGGFLVPADIIMRLITKKPVPTAVAAYVTTIDTNRDRIVMPKAVYTADNRYTSPVRITWTGEVPASSTQHLVTQPVFGQFEAPVHTAMMSLPVTNDQLEDSGIALMAYIESCFNEAIDLVAEDLILNGTGVKQPSGILQSPGGANEPAVSNSGAAADFTADGFKTIQFALPPQYQSNARWVMNWTNSAQTIEKMKDADGRYLWGNRDNGLSVNQFDLPLLGRPVVYNEFAPNVGAGTYPVVYGDLSAYYWVRRIGFSIQILNELNALLNQKVLLGRLRVGGDVAEDWALKIMQIAA